MLNCSVQDQFDAIGSGAPQALSIDTSIIIVCTGTSPSLKCKVTGFQDPALEIVNLNMWITEIPDN